jgi:hypothetical protein
MVRTAVSIGIAGAVAFMLIAAGVGAWWLPWAAAGGVLLVSACVFIMPPLFAPPRAPEDLVAFSELEDKDRIQFADDRRKLQNDIRTALVQAVGGGAVLVTLLLTWQQQQATSQQIADQLAVTRQGQVGERFSGAVSQLGDESVDVRLGGLYELEQLARQAPDRRLVIIEVVAAYVRQHARPTAPTTAPPTRLPSDDVEAALTIIERRSIEMDNPLVELDEVDLGGANLIDVTLEDVDLAHANFREAILVGSHFRGSYLSDADFRDANLIDADLSLTALSDTDFRGANLAGANLRKALLVGADLRDAKLSDRNRAADLRGATADRLTQWPKGFDWRGAGVEQVE